MSGVDEWVFYSRKTSMTTRKFLLQFILLYILKIVYEGMGNLFSHVQIFNDAQIVDVCLLGDCFFNRWSGVCEPAY